MNKRKNDWFLSRNILLYTQDDCYEIVDELLRVRVIMDMYEDYGEVESELIIYGHLLGDGNVSERLWGAS